MSAGLFASGPVGIVQATSYYQFTGAVTFSGAVTTIVSAGANTNGLIICSGLVSLINSDVASDENFHAPLGIIRVPAGVALDWRQYYDSAPFASTGHVELRINAVPFWKSNMHYGTGSFGGDIIVGYRPN